MPVSIKQKRYISIGADSDNSGGGGTGTMNYNELDHKPQINGVTLRDNKTADDLDLVTKDTTQTISGPKTFTGAVKFEGNTDLGDNASAQTKPTSDTSDAPATTKFVKDFAQDGEWQKPADWIDIRSGALDNSVYFLVAHSKPTESGGVYSIATYPKFSIYAGVSTDTNNYDVFVDGIKVATTAHHIATTIDWATLYNNGTLQGGYDVMYPSELTTHVVRVTPSVATDTLSIIRLNVISGQDGGQGVLWVHFELQNAINIYQLLGSSSPTARLPLVEALTAKNDKIKYTPASGSASGLNYFAAYANSLKKLPILEAENSDYIGGIDLCFNGILTKKITIKNNSEKLPIQLIHNFKGEYFEAENPVSFVSGTSGTTNASGATNLKKLPAISTKEKGTTLIMGRLDSIEETFIDESFNDERTLLRIDGASGHQTNLVGLVVSPEAPFDYATAPQLSVNYTNMSRAALVRLFKSLPYNVGYTVVGNPTIVDGIASGFSADDYIQINKSFDYSKDFEMQFAITFNSFTSASRIINFIGTAGTLAFNETSGRPTFLLQFTENGTNKSVTLYDGNWSVTQTNQKTYFRFGREGNTLFLKSSTDLVNWREITAEIPDTYIPIPFTNINIGTSSSHIDGSLDLNETYIKVAGLPWFRGTPAMTKSISVVGATGTADLTAEDKAIAEDKGWSIVLS